MFGFELVDAGVDGGLLGAVAGPKLLYEPMCQGDHLPPYLVSALKVPGI